MFLVSNPIRCEGAWGDLRSSWFVGTSPFQSRTTVEWMVDLEREETTNPSNPVAVVFDDSKTEGLNRDRYLPLSRNPTVAMTKCPAYATLGKATKGELHTYETAQR